MGRILSIDFGLKRIGLAISDENRILASPLGTIEAKKNCKETIDALLQHCKTYKIDKIVVGNPIQMNGKKGFLANEVLHFVTELKTQVSCDVILWDERLTSVQADRALIEGGYTRKKRAQKVDPLAAVLILQSYLGF